MKIALSNLLDWSLYPISWLWEWAYRVRRFLYTYGFFSRYYFQVPVISVGNLNFGGTGKTPFTLWLGEYLNSQGKKVMILMRGYKGKLESSFGILKSNRRLGFDPFKYGDESLLLARRLKNASIVVGKRRTDNLEFYFDRERPDVVLLDDGHQHIQLKRQLNIVLFDTFMDIDSYKVAPRGYLREGLTALRDADLVVLGRCDIVEPCQIDKLKKLISAHLNFKVPIAEIKYTSSGLFDSSYHLKFTAKEIRGRRVICIVGVASPEPFFGMVEKLGANIVEKIALPDHHFITRTEAKKYLQLAKQKKALLVTTEKDMVKMRGIFDDEQIVYLEIQVEFISGEEKVREIITQVVEFTHVSLR